MVEGENIFHMTNEEMVVKLQNGYDGYDEFLARNMGMVYERAHYFSRRITSLEYEDLVSIFLFEVYRAVKYYNPTLGIKFTTYAYRFMINTFYNILRAEELRKNLHNHSSLNQKAIATDSESAEIIDLIVDDSLLDFNDIVYPNEEHIKLVCIKVLRKHNYSERNIGIVMSLLSKQTKTEVLAKKIGITRQRISVIYIEARKLLKEELPNYGIDFGGIDWGVRV